MGGGNSSAYIGLWSCAFVSLAVSLITMGAIYSGRDFISRHSERNLCLVLEVEKISFECPVGPVDHGSTCTATQYTVVFNDSQGNLKIASSNPSSESDIYADPHYTVGSVHTCYVVGHFVYWSLPKKLENLRIAMIVIGSLLTTLLVAAILIVSTLAFRRKSPVIDSTNVEEMKQLLVKSL